jgi:uncharacterized DUF497 family protein
MDEITFEWDTQKAQKNDLKHDNIPDTLLGSLWLDIMELIVNKPKDILTLKVCEINNINVL